MRQKETTAFNKMSDDITERIHCLNLLTDAGTVVGFKALHPIIMNPHSPNDLIPFDAYENCSDTRNGDEEFFKEMITQIQEHHLELVAIVCDNDPVQVSGVWQSLAFVPHLAICHISCLNCIVNLVFVHVLEQPAVARRVKVVDEVIRDLRSSQGIVILGRRCPTVVMTRWIYAVEVLHYILQYAEDVDTVPTVSEQGIVPDNFKALSRMFLPLRCFSGSMETRGRRLYEVTPFRMRLCVSFVK
jgi:hypothetical protein